MLVYAVVFGVDDGWGRVHGGRVHVWDEVGVVGLLGPEVGTGFRLVVQDGRGEAPEGVDTEDGVGEGCDGAEDGASRGRGAPLVGARRQEVVGYGDEAEGRGGESGSG